MQAHREVSTRQGKAKGMKGQRQAQAEEGVWQRLISLTPPRKVGGSEVAPSPSFGGPLGICVGSGADGQACRYADSGSARNELAANAGALCHVSAKNLVGETQYWKVPHI